VSVEVIPTGIDRSDRDAIDRYLWKKDFDYFPVVVAIKVTGRHEYADFFIVDVKPVRLWKSDVQPVQHVYIRKPTGVPCYVAKTDLELMVGETYVLFTKRIGPLLEYVKVDSEPLAHGYAYETDERLEKYLDGLAPMWVRLAAGRQPNPSLERP
jgi:hypothetical protein